MMFIDIKDRKINNVDELFIAIDEFLNNDPYLTKEMDEIWELVLNSFSTASEEEYKKNATDMAKNVAELLFPKFDSFEVLQLNLFGFKYGERFQLMELAD